MHLQRTLLWQQNVHVQQEQVVTGYTRASWKGIKAKQGHTKFLEELE